MTILDPRPGRRWPFRKCLNLARRVSVGQFYDPQHVVLSVPERDDGWADIMGTLQPAVSGDQMYLIEARQRRQCRGLAQELKRRGRRVRADLRLRMMALEPNPVVCAHANLPCYAPLDEEHARNIIKKSDEVVPKPIMDPIRETSLGGFGNEMRGSQTVFRKIAPSRRHGLYQSARELVPEFIESRVRISIRFHTGKYTILVGGPPVAASGAPLDQNVGTWRLT